MVVVVVFVVVVVLLKRTSFAVTSLTAFSTLKKVFRLHKVSKNLLSNNSFLKFQTSLIAIDDHCNEFLHTLQEIFSLHSCTFLNWESPTFLWFPTHIICTDFPLNQRSSSNKYLMVKKSQKFAKKKEDEFLFQSVRSVSVFQNSEINRLSFDLLTYKNNQNFHTFD